jgi:hypothetical protein
LKFIEYCDRLFWGYFGKAIANLFCFGFERAIAGVKSAIAKG